MSISRASVLETLAQKGFSCLNIQDYKTLDSKLKIKCNNGHELEVNFRTARDERYKCPYCEGKNSLGVLMFSEEPPLKNGKRIVAIDNATKNAGVAVFDSGKLVHHELREFSGETVERLVQNRHFILDTVVKKWKPDLVVIEDIQLQNNVKLFKVLSMLSGNVQTALFECGIKCEVVPSKTWRAHFQINGDRIADKAQAIDRIMQMYGMVVTDDVAEAILLGKYAVDKISTHQSIKLF